MVVAGFLVLLQFYAVNFIIVQTVSFLRKRIKSFVANTINVLGNETSTMFVLSQVDRLMQVPQARGIIKKPYTTPILYHN